MSDDAPEVSTHDLSASAKLVTPITTPLVNILPRRPGGGADILHWHAVTAFLTPWATEGEPTFTVMRCAAEVQSTLVRAPATDDDIHTVDFRPIKEHEEAWILQELIRQVREGAASAPAVTAITLPQDTNALSIEAVDHLLMTMHQHSGADPDYLVLHSTQQQVLTACVLAAHAEKLADALSHRTDSTFLAAYRITHWINKATGKVLPILVDRHCPPDVVLALSLSWPPVAESLTVTSTSKWGRDQAPTTERVSDRPAIELEVNQDYTGWQEADEVVVAVNEALKIHWLGGQGLLHGLAAPLKDRHHGQD